MKRFKKARVNGGSKPIGLSYVMDRILITSTVSFDNITFSSENRQDELDGSIASNSPPQDLQPDTNFEGRLDVLEEQIEFYTSDGIISNRNDSTAVSRLPHQDESSQVDASGSQYHPTVDSIADSAVTVCGININITDGRLIGPTGRQVLCRHCGQLINADEPRIRWPKKRAWQGTAVTTHQTCFLDVNTVGPQSAMTHTSAREERSSDAASNLPITDATVEEARLGREASCVLCGDVIQRGLGRLVWRNRGRATHCHLHCRAAADATRDFLANGIVDTGLPTGGNLSQRTGAESNDTPPSEGERHIELIPIFHTTPTPTDEVMTSENTNPVIDIQHDRAADFQFPALVLPRFDSDAENVSRLWQLRIRHLESYLRSGEDSELWKFLYLPGILMIDLQRLRENTRSREIKRRIMKLLSGDEMLIESLIALSPAAVGSLHNEPNNVKKIEKLIIAGEVGRAGKLLGRPGHIEPTNDVIQKLRDLHSQDDPNPVCPAAPRNTLTLTVESLRLALKKMPRLSGSGASGDTIDLWKSAVEDDVHAYSLSELINRIINGQISFAGFQLLKRTKMLAIPKRGTNAVRPIAVGEVARRVAATCLLSACSNEIENAVGGMQYGVGIKAGSGKAILATQTLLESGQDLIATDISNAFGNLSRQALLDAVGKKLPKILPVVEKLYSSNTLHLVKKPAGTAVIRCSRGVDQGCPLSPLLFAICMSEILEHAGLTNEGRSQSPLCAAIAFLDDVMLNRSYDEHALGKFMDSCARFGLTINLSKSHKLERGMSHTVLGAPAFHGENSGYGNFITFFDNLNKAIDNGLSLHAAWILAKVCGGCMIGHALSYNVETEEALLALEDYERKILDRICGTTLDDNAWKRACLPCRLGGIGAHSFITIAPSAKLGTFAMCRDKVEQVTGFDLAELQTDQILELKRMTSLLAMQGAIPRQRGGIADCSQHSITSCLNTAARESIVGTSSTEDLAHLSSCAVSHSVYWLYNLNRFLPDDVFRTAIKLRLRMSLCDNGPCPIVSSNGAECNLECDPFGDHTLRCLRGGQSVKCHNAVRDIMGQIAEAEGFLSSLEEEVLPATTESPAAVMDVVLRRQDLTCPIMIDVSIVHAVAGEHRVNVSRSNMGGAGSRRREYEKVRKYGHVIENFHPFCIETTGRLGQYAIKLLYNIIPSPADRPRIIGSIQAAMLCGLWKRIATTVAKQRQRRYLINTF